MKRRSVLRAGVAGGVAALLPRFAIGQSADARALRFVPQANLTVLDPIVTTAAVTANHAWMVWDTLFGVNAAQQAKPQMADGYTISDDGRTYLIKLREGLRWHDGEPVRAQDCAASLARWAVRNTFGQTAAKSVDEWGVADDKTVKITLKQPFPLLIDAIAVQNSFIMPERLAKTDPFKAINEVVGSGPYQFLKDEFVPGSSAAWEKSFWGPSDGSEVHRALPLHCRADLSRHTRPAHPPGACPGVPAAWLPAAALQLIRKVLFI